jgi:hypothetical protein
VAPAEDGALTRTLSRRERGPNTLPLPSGEDPERPGLLGQYGTPDALRCFNAWAYHSSSSKNRAARR